MTASSGRKPWRSNANMANVTTPVRTPATNSGMPKSRLKPKAAPRNSARSVAMATNSIKTHMVHTASVGTGRGNVPPGSSRWRSQLCRERLGQHRHEVAGHDHPEEHIAILGAALDIRGEVPGST